MFVDMLKADIFCSKHLDTKPSIFCKHTTIILFTEPSFNKGCKSPAEALINDQQLLLPGFRIQSKFRDDKCNGDRAVRIILEETATSDQWVGIGGLGCLGTRSWELIVRSFPGSNIEIERI